MTLKKSKIPFTKTGQFSKLFVDYINGNPNLSQFYKYKPTLESFQQIISDKSKENIDRKLLFDILEKQYSKLTDTKTSDQTQFTTVNKNIRLLLDESTFTVCTGHQLCLFTGPLYFIYKIITTINLSETLKKKYPAFNFVPVYWMASEDHDFEEISSIHLFGKKVSWNNPLAKGAVGRLNPQSISFVIDELKQIIGESENAKCLIQLFNKAYNNHQNLSEATRYLVHQLFAKYGLVIIDADDANLKNKFSEIMKDDILHQTNFKIVQDTNTKLESLGVKSQVNPREINIFYLNNGDRVRIEKDNFKSETLIPELHEHPERFSPNVILRPVYQQKILPNLAYIGGPGEIAYWLQYKAMFDHHQLVFPILIPRNFVLLIDEKSKQQIEKSGFTIIDIFKDADSLIKEYVNKNAGNNLSLKEQEEKLSLIYNEISIKATAVDITLKGTVDAEMQKTLNALKTIETKLLRAEKQKHETSINQIKKIKDKFFPEGMLQERYENMIPYYLKSGKEFISDIKNNFDPFEFEMLILEI